MEDISNQGGDSCQDAVYSEDYIDLVVGIFGSLYQEWMQDPNLCIQSLNLFQRILHYRTAEPMSSFFSQVGYRNIPKCYGLLDTAAMEATGVLSLRRQPYINLYGQNVILGFLDTGIDYRHPVFLNEDNTSRILAIWDQTQREGTPPEGLSYGAVYTREDINRALASDNPYDVVPERDELGHGTFLAGLAAGNEDPANNFTGAAPRADIVMVKLKQAKENLRRFFEVLPDAPCFQETDILMGLRFLQEIATKYRRPFVVCLGIGTNSGDHAGNSVLDRFLNGYGDTPGIGVIVAAGNEANARHHFRGELDGGNSEEVELQAGEGRQSFTMELWASTPPYFSIGLLSPRGEIREKLPIRAGRVEEVRFLFENTTVEVYYEPIERVSGAELIFIRFLTPAPGLWKLRVYNESPVAGVYHIWLPMKGFVAPDTFFIRADPDTTLCGPGNTPDIITTAAYDYRNDSIYLDSSRGFTRKMRIQPTISAPGVNVYGPTDGGNFAARSGTSAAAAICAGVCALLLEWGIISENLPYMGNRELMHFIITGARQKTDLVYPNQSWGSNGIIVSSS